MLKIYLDKSVAINGWSIYAHRYTQTGRIPFKVEITQMPEVSECELAAPSFQANWIEAEEVFKAIVEALTEAGMLPKMGATEAELVATRKHLADMRALVFESVRPDQKA